MQTNCSDLKHILALPIRGQNSVGYEHRSLEILLGSLENLPARRALVLEMLKKNFARISLGSIGARKKSMLELARLEFFMLEMLEIRSV